MKKYRVALLGLGTVGSGVIRILQSHSERITQQANATFEIAGILVRRLNKKRSVSVEPSLLTTDYHALLSQGIDIVIDAMGGVDPTLSYIELAIKNGCHVISANKELLALHGPHLHTLAEHYNVSLLYEASVGGGIPILNTLNHLLKANRITRVHGILNGTTNYILTKMEEENLPYEAVLQQAQQFGFAEADPTSDVEGFDALNKITIISHLCFGSEGTKEHVYHEGITKVTSEEIALYKKIGYRLKLIAMAERTVSGSRHQVRPVLLPHTHSLAGVKNEYNGIFVNGDIVGDLFFTGKGAGSLPTGSAIVEDMINAVQGLRFTAHPFEPALPEKESDTDSSADAIAVVFAIDQETYSLAKTRLLSFLSTEAGYLHSVDAVHTGSKTHVGAILTSGQLDKIEAYAEQLGASLTIRPVLDESLPQKAVSANALTV
ncbi:homoserine dehydrogenase [Aneurinibacillus terranovensis]|uniref:homoserine dehydrogenase n=1 Tax=Aneurinibacillus terranovensis TaxID=278991 RepID=UPI0003FF4A48|nr:homoserine dehydrogenase [Aneurinibacillus terranovensis]